MTDGVLRQAGPTVFGQTISPSLSVFKVSLTCGVPL